MTNEFAELDRVRRLIIILSCCTLALLVVLWFAVPARAWVAGFILGGAISVYNVLYLGHRIKIASRSALAGKRPRGLGLLNRIFMVAFGMILAYRFPEWVDYRSTALGLPIGYILMLASTLICMRKESKKREGRVVLGDHPDSSFSRSKV